MQGIAGSRFVFLSPGDCSSSMPLEVPANSQLIIHSTRDLSLVEKVAGSPTGTISFVSTSVITPKVPRVSGRVRATLALNGWVLEPIDGGTRITY